MPFLLIPIWLVMNGADAAWIYQTGHSLVEALVRACPDG